MKKLLYLCIVTVALLLSDSTSVALAQPAQGTVTSIVDCGRIGQDPCEFDDLITVVQNAIEFVIIYVITPLITLVILYYGVMLVVAGDKPAQIKKAKKALWSVVVGLFFMLTAWLLVAAVIKAFDVKVNTDPTKGPIKLLDTKK
jgi:Type IV secretion system pilin